MIRRGREKRHPYGAAPKEPTSFSSNIAHFDFDPSYAQKSQLGLQFNNSAFQLAKPALTADFNLTRVGLSPGFFISFWVVWTNNGAAQYIIGKTDGIVSALFDYDLFISTTGVVTFQTYNTSYTLGNAFATVALVAGTLTHVAINCNYSNATRFGVDFYINNTLRGSYNFTGARRADTCQMRIGSNALANSGFLVSRIDQLFIRKNYFITANIRNQLYNSGS